MPDKWIENGLNMIENSSRSKIQYGRDEDNTPGEIVYKTNNNFILI